MTNEERRADEFARRELIKSALLAGVMFVVYAGLGLMAGLVFING